MDTETRKQNSLDQFSALEATRTCSWKMQIHVADELNKKVYSTHVHKMLHRLHAERFVRVLFT